MSQIDNINDIALSSEFPTDKIVQVLSGSFNTATAPKQQSDLGFDVYSMHTVSHGYTRPVFTKLKWSIDGVNWVDGGLGQLESDPLIFCVAYSTASNVVILSTDLGSYTIYYQVICFWIDDYDGTDPSVDAFFGPTSKPFAFDSRLNYQKIVEQGEVSVTGTSDTKVIPHGLGSIPNAWLYFESNPGQVWPAVEGGVQNVWLYNYATQGEIRYAINASNMTVDWSAGASFSGSARVWYRIYGEGL